VAATRINSWLDISAVREAMERNAALMLGVGANEKA